MPSGAGQTKTATLVLTNVTSSAKTYAVSVGPVTGAGVAFSVDKSSVAIAPGMSAAVSVTMTAAQGAAVGHHYATLTVGSSHAALYTYVK